MWAGVGALDDTFNHTRLGNFGYPVYETEFNLSAYPGEFHDILVGDNGEVGTLPGFRAGHASGNGTPDVFNFIRTSGI